MAIREVTYRQYICDAKIHDPQTKVLGVGAMYTLLRNLADGTEKLVCTMCKRDMTLTDILTLIGVGTSAGKVPPSGSMSNHFPIAGDKDAG
jgi:hypothetical protein